MLGSARLIGAVVGIGLLLGAVHGVLKAERDKGRAQCKAEVEAELARESKRTATAIAEVANEAQRMQNRIAADRATAAVSAERLRGAVAGNGLVIRPAAAAASAPASDAAGVFDQLLERAVRLAAIADERGAAGTACERAYDVLTP